MTNDRDDLRFLRDAKVDHFGSMMVIGAYVALVVLTLCSVLGKIHPPVSLVMKGGGEVNDETLLAVLVVFGALGGAVGAWARIKRANQRKDVL